MAPAEHDAILELNSALEALEHHAIHGWGSAGPDKVLVKNSNKEGYLKHDHKCLQAKKRFDKEVIKLLDKRKKSKRTFEGEIMKLANNINHFLRTREIEVFGCTPPEDCRDIYRNWTCANMTSNGTCRIERN